MNFQKQFDTVTGALNIFDMSYLVSGAAMMTGLFIHFLDSVILYFTTINLRFQYLCVL